MISLEEESKVFQKLNPREYYKAFIDKGIRHNGRKLGDYRRMDIDIGFFLKVLFFNIIVYIAIFLF